MSRFTDTPRWRRKRKAWLKRHPLCAHCRQAGVYKQASQVDHIVPRSKGGALFDDANLQSLCLPCHGRKTANEQHFVKMDEHGYFQEGP